MVNSSKDNLLSNIEKEILKLSTRSLNDVLSKIFYWIDLQFKDTENYIDGYIPQKVYRKAIKSGSKKWIRMGYRMTQSQWIEVLNHQEITENAKESDEIFVLLPCLHQITKSNSQMFNNCPN